MIIKWSKRILQKISAFIEIKKNLLIKIGIEFCFKLLNFIIVNTVYVFFLLQI